MAIFLESLQLPPGEDGDGGGLDGLLRRLRAAGYEVPEEDVLGEPFWLQDDNDGMCLGPGGTFGQCGDASLWLVRKRRRRRRRGGRSILSRLVKDRDDADAASVWGYALELVDVSAGRRRPRDDGSGSDAVADRDSHSSDKEGECLVSSRPPTSVDADEEDGSSKYHSDDDKDKACRLITPTTTAVNKQLYEGRQSTRCGDCFWTRHRRSSPAELTPTSACCGTRGPGPTAYGGPTPPRPWRRNAPETAARHRHRHSRTTGAWSTFP